MTSTDHHKLIILGSGPAGYTAAVYAARAGISPLLITGMQLGGQLALTTTVDNWPGDVAGVMGPELMTRMHEHALRYGTTIINDHINTAQLQKQPLTLLGERRYTCDALIIATGAQAKWLGLPSESQYIGKGVSSCATCDGFFYRNQDVAVIGGGNTAVEEALYLSNIAAKVLLIHRRDKLSAEKILQDHLYHKAKTKGNIEFLWHNVAEEIIGNAEGVTHLKVRNNQTNLSTTIPLHGVFVAIGHTPNTAIFNEQLSMHNGYISVNGGASNYATATSIPGVFAAGDVSDPIYRQAITSAGSGCMAALDAEKYLQTL